ncbi:MAG: hypothetical protein R3B70_24440 [Polyangiaceae bacterium]
MSPSSVPDEEHPLLAALARAPIGEPLSAEERAMLDEHFEDIRLGRVELVLHEDREAWRRANAVETV